MKMKVLKLAAIGVSLMLAASIAQAHSGHVGNDVSISIKLMHFMQLDRLEDANIDNPAGGLAVAYHLIQSGQFELSLFLDHESGLNTQETHSGLNALGVEARNRSGTFELYGRFQAYRDHEQLEAAGIDNPAFAVGGQVNMIDSNQVILSSYVQHTFSPGKFGGDDGLTAAGIEVRFRV